MFEQIKVPFITIFFFFAMMFSFLFAFIKLVGPIPLTINSTQTNKNTFYVQGVGEVKATPDTAKVSLGVTVHAATADEAKSQMNEITNKVVTQLKTLGITDKEIKTTNFSVSEDAEPQPITMALPTVDVVGPEKVVTGSTTTETNKPAVAGSPANMMIALPKAPETKPTAGKTQTPEKTFSGSQTIEVTTKTIELANQAIDMATKLGVNALGTPIMTVNDEKRKTLVKEARSKAIADAKQKAQTLALEVGMKLGKVVDIQESGGGNMYYAKDMAMSARAESAPTQLNAGEDTITVNVSLSYETL